MYTYEKRSLLSHYSIFIINTLENTGIITIFMKLNGRKFYTLFLTVELKVYLSKSYMFT